VGGGAQQVDPSAIDADLPEGPAPAEAGQDAEPPGLGREHELAGAPGVGGGRGGKGRRCADVGHRWWRRDGRRPRCVVGQRLYARAPLIWAHPRTTSTTAPSRSSAAGATSPSTCTPSTASERTPVSTCSGLDTRTVTSAPRNRRRTSYPSHSAGIAGAMRKPSSAGCTPRRYCVTAV